MATRPKLVNKQFNSPINLYSAANVQDTLNKQTQLLANGAVGIDFHNNPATTKPGNLANSAVLRMLEEEEQRQRKGQSPRMKVLSKNAVIKINTARVKRRYLWPPKALSDVTNKSFRKLDSFEKQSVNTIQIYLKAPGLKRVAWPPPADFETNGQDYVEETPVYSQGGPNYHTSTSPNPINRANVGQVRPVPLKPFAQAKSPLAKSPVHSPQVSSFSPHPFTPTKVQSPHAFTPTKVPSPHPFTPTKVHSPLPTFAPTKIQSPQTFSPTTVHSPHILATSPFGVSVIPSPQSRGFQPANQSPRGWAPVASPTPIAPSLQSHPQQQFQAPQQQQQYQPQATQAFRPVAAPVFEPPPATVTLRQQAPISQKPSPVVTSQPATASLNGGSNMRGDQKWPPAEVKAAAEAENKARVELAKGPACRPRKVRKDYSHFFAQHALNSTYPGYRAPPGTQHYDDNTGSSAF